MEKRAYQYPLGNIEGGVQDSGASPAEQFAVFALVAVAERHEALEETLRDLSGANFIEQIRQNVLRNIAGGEAR